MKEFLKILLIIAVALILRFIVMTGIVLLFTFGTQYEKTNDITKYNDVIGNKAKGVYEINGEWVKISSQVMLNL